MYVFQYCSWGSRGKNTGVVCHSLVQWITFYHKSRQWPFCLGWPCPMAHSFTELLKSLHHDKAVVHEGMKHIADKDLFGQSYGFSSSHVQIWELDHKKGWAPKNWCFQIMVLEKTLWESPRLQGDQPSQSWRKSTWIFMGRTDSKTAAPILWPILIQYWCEELTP